MNLLDADWLFALPSSSSSSLPSAAVTLWTVQRLLGVANLMAFCSWLAQLRGLVGARGLVPAQLQLHRIAAQLRAAHPSDSAARGAARRFIALPTLLWLGNGADWALRGVAWTGVVAAMLLLMDVWSGAALLACAGCYLSSQQVARPFLSQQLDLHLLELDLLVGLLGSCCRVRWPALVLGVLRFCLLRNLLASCAAKLRAQCLPLNGSGHLSQPLPGPLAWHLHRAPACWHRLVSLVTWLVEGPLALAVASPHLLPWRALELSLLLALLVVQQLSGSYGFQGVLLLAQYVALLDDNTWPGWMHRTVAQASRADGAEANWRLALALALVLGYGAVHALTAVLQVAGARPAVALSRVFVRMCVTQPRPLRQRHEVVPMGTRDGIEWRLIRFQWKPSHLEQRPSWPLAGHLPRLDWCAAFILPQGNGGNSWESAPSAPPAWWCAMMRSLLEGRREVLELLDETANPFPPDRPAPIAVRAALYDFSFSYDDDELGHGQRRRPDLWWNCRFCGYYGDVYCAEGVELQPNDVQTDDDSFMYGAQRQELVGASRARSIEL